MAQIRALFLLISFGAALCPGGIVSHYTLQELTSGSEIIIEGRITHTWTAWDRKHKYIWTHYDVQIEEALKGTASSVTVSEPGGSLDGIQQMFTGSVPYGAGEHVVLFLYRTPIGYLRTRGGPQGKFSFVNNSSATELKRQVRNLMKSELR